MFLSKMRVNIVLLTLCIVTCTLFGGCWQAVEPGDVLATLGGTCPYGCTGCVFNCIIAQEYGNITTIDDQYYCDDPDGLMVVIQCFDETGPIPGDWHIEYVPHTSEAD